MGTSDKGTPMAQPEQPHSILQVTGRDRIGFLQNLVTNDISAPGLHYTALLTPQGKYLADFFVLHRPDDLLIDVASEICPSIVMRLNMYRFARRCPNFTNRYGTVLRLGPDPTGWVCRSARSKSRLARLRTTGGRCHQLASLACRAYHTRDRKSS
jgi:hypothetical protein